MTTDSDLLERIFNNWSKAQWISMSVNLFCSSLISVALVSCFYVITRNDMAIILHKIDSVAPTGSINSVNIGSPRSTEENAREILKKQGLID